MTTFPLEVLILIFKSLERDDLTQCQLVSRLWNEASRKQLYEDIRIISEETSRRYVRTIEACPELGKHLKDIQTGSIFQTKEDDPFWDRHGLLDTLIKHCPNLLRLGHRTTSTRFWTKLMYAASQGRLPRLQYMECPWSGDFECYVYAALSFKNTLTWLELRNLDDENPKSLASEAYPILRGSLNEFPCLQTLIVSYVSEQPLSHYDALIDDCKHLKQLEIEPSNPNVSVREVMTPPGPSIYPHLNIDTLKCRWFSIKEDEQLNYMMQKFPNLKSLTVDSDGFEYEYFKPASDVLLKFLRFVTNVQEVTLDILMEEQECVKVWADIINEKCPNIDLTLSFSQFLMDPEMPIVSVYFEQQYRLTLNFLPSQVTESLYKELLSNSGDNVRRLVLKASIGNSVHNYGIFSNVDNIVEVLQLCPSLQHLVLWSFNGLPFSDNTAYRHTKVKSLSIYQGYANHITGILKSMSAILPNMKEIVLLFGKNLGDKSGISTIMVPNSSLDILKIRFSKIAVKDNGSPDVYIRLCVNSVEKFYIAFEEELLSIGPKQYNYPRPNNVCLDITCQDLIKLQINQFIYTF